MTDDAAAPSSSPDFSGRSVVITGVGKRGQVGEAVARAFSDHGATLFLVDRNGDAAIARASEMPNPAGQTSGFGCDLSNPEDVAALVTRIEGALPGGLDVLVNMAGGFAMSGRISDADVAVWHRQFAINLTTAFLTTRAFLPLLRKARGAIVFFASAAALPGAGVAQMAAYAAAKTGVVTLMRAVAAEEKDTGVRANALAPTSVRTESNIASMGKEAKYVEREAVAECVMWLASAASSPVNGQVIKLG